jgi:hypothetical protein
MGRRRARFDRGVLLSDIDVDEKAIGSNVRFDFR